ncbi:hypothetical protein K443DRAFT_7457 [Laccaria amethystina LaAM-08-1]|uniref:Unplaced genomic scaffold K443scaffold_85, whole genome shotgun sequence n=1 Tax=Laccaria amethystina LaAM-08-1 TaxID=1095629 RepID=A0A0C9X6K5_9AGAR|nr:hypothetical protein K443DRAFT_7457 [Laccaria amethystina LaAM-08-1]
MTTTTRLPTPTTSHKRRRPPTDEAARPNDEGPKTNTNDASTPERTQATTGPGAMSLTATWQPNDEQRPKFVVRRRSLFKNTTDDEGTRLTTRDEEVFLFKNTTVDEGTRLTTRDDEAATRRTRGDDDTAQQRDNDAGWRWHGGVGFEDCQANGVTDRRWAWTALSMLAGIFTGGSLLPSFICIPVIVYIVKINESF